MHQHRIVAEGARAGAGDGFELQALPDALSFKLFRMVALNERNGAFYFKKELGVTLLEWRILGLVVAHEPATMRDVRRMLLMDRGLFSRTVKEMRASGLLTVDAHPEDKRQMSLRPTRAGSDLHDRCLAYTKARNDRMAEPLTPQERSEFVRLLDKLIAHNHRILMQKDRGDD